MAPYGALSPPPSLPPLYRFLLGTGQGLPWRLAVLLLLSIGGGVVAAIAIATGQGPVDAWRSWQAARAAASVGRIAEKDGVAAAIASVDQAYRRAPQHADVVRAYAHLCAIEGEEAALYLFSRLELLGAMTPPDRAMRARALVSLGRVPEAEPEIDALIAEGFEDTHLYSSLAGVLATRNDAEGARLAFVKASSLDGFTDRDAVAFARLLSAYPQGIALTPPELLLALAAQLQETIESGVAPGPDLDRRRRSATTAMATLGQFLPLASPVVAPIFPDELAAARARFASWVRRLPDAPISSRLDALAIELDQPDPALARDAWARERDTFNASSPDQKAAFALLLARHNLYSEIIDLVPAEAAASHPQLFATLLAALAMQGRWEETEAILAAPRTPMTAEQEAFVSYLLSSAQSKLDPAQRAGRLGALVDRARSAHSPQLALFAARLAFEEGEDEIAWRALSPFFSGPAAETVARTIESWERASHARGKASRVRQAYSLALRQSSPASHTIRQHLYFQLLDGALVELALHQASPGRPHQDHLIAALALHRLGDSASIRQVLRRLLAGQLPHQHRAILAALLQLHGDPQTAAAILPSIQLDTLLDEELALLRTSGLHR